MSRPELILENPVEIDGVTHMKLRVQSYDAINRCETHSVPRMIGSLATVFGVPRPIIRKLHPSDAVRAGALVLALREELFGD